MSTTPGSLGASEHITEWAELFDDLYERDHDEYAGWNSTFTNRPQPRADMDEWADHTARLILAGAPESVLEIGCGTGAIARRLRRSCTDYTGTDISEAALRAVARTCPDATLLHGDATDLRQLADRTYDTVVLNSVVQYFPGRAYLERVLDAIVPLAAPGGRIIVGDVRNLALLRAFHLSAQATNWKSGSIPREELAARTNWFSRQEEELLVSPRLFSELPLRHPSIASVAVVPKRGWADNEMTKFRFDVVINFGAPARLQDSVPWVRVTTVGELEQAVTDNPAGIRARAVPNGRLYDERALLSWADERDEPVAQGIHPERVYALAARRGLHAQLSLASASPDGAFDLMLHQTEGAVAFDVDPLAPRTEALTNHPLAPKLRNRLAADLRTWCEAELPDYARPREIVVVDQLPLTSNGKVDVAALGWMRAPRGASRPAAPRSTLERDVVEIWCEVLGLGEVDIDDDFFDLGGDSLKAVRLANRLQRRMGDVVHSNAVFDAPTVRRMTQYLREHYDASEAASARPATVTVDALQVAALSRRFAEFYRDHEAGPRVGGRQNDQAAFILSAPRSGSTLLRVMLAGHPALFVPPELELLGFETIAARDRALVGRNAYLGSGLTATLQALGLDEASLDALRRRNGTTKEAYALIQNTLGGRLLVDKSANYASRPETLRRAEAWFEEPKYVYLTRHPESCARSYVSSRLELLTDWGLDYEPAAIGTLSWFICNRNITSHLDTVDPARWMTVHYESLVQDPRACMEQVSEFLGVGFDERLLTPYDGAPSRMTGTDDPESRVVGDVKFRDQAEISPTPAAIDERGWSRLTPQARQLAGRLGYAATGLVGP
jgi:SAM-dependent methyltransferase/acyl carrier protein